MNKPRIIIYLNNLLAYFLFRSLKCLFPGKRRALLNPVLFINSGQIGDLIVSAMLFDNEEKLAERYDRLVLLVRDNYMPLYENYKGKIELRCYSYRRYKWNIIYKVALLKWLRSCHFKYCLNLTAARGVLNDEMALLSGAERTYALSPDWKYLKKIFGKKMDTFYNGILGESENEYRKHSEALAFLLPGLTPASPSNGNKLLFRSAAIRNSKLYLLQPEKKYIVIAPFSSARNRDWPAAKFSALIGRLENRGYNLILLGSGDQKAGLDLFKSENKTVTVWAGELSLSEIPSLLSCASLFLGVDSGLTHIALRLKIPTVAIIGGGMYGKFLPSPFSDINAKYISAECSYFKCEWNCRYREKKCITDIRVDDIYNTVSGLIEL